MEENIIIEALKFMVLGMGVVFSFLIILIFVLKGQAALISKYFPEKEKQPVKKPQAPVASNSTKIAAIMAAVQHHENLKG
ncbi:OadG family protein [Malaciobacter marinus]|uniref:Probable oxaloacetate decarboxylase gamma chain n=1 Tax=Malaciobacter marinus TaxID=505249 RepID=A0A347TKH3_9BACT|nr:MULTISPECIES: OadG family protein [Malaciobacter]AXX87101.1 oxaloacetate decarboxylase, gamma subunit [Malaciobacter marinus]PHO12310.1 sodium pump decarboxylase subunit gamma [Malaciobacter marinus]PHO16311.1 sodium pump decarboxylase subunit gamma [Malaciobacter marinus]RYA22894.1 sodium pump decarboxylase subunit gamma [Malaciobacter halophilus]